MNYEKRYKDALERAKKLYGQGTITESLGFVFPELNEKGYGERIRKELIEHIKANKGTDYVLFKKFSPDDVIAWLEKQKNTPDKEYVFRPLAGDTIEKAVERAVKLDGKVVLAFNGAYIPVYNKTKDEIVAEYHDWIKKQDKQKPTIWSEEDEQSKNWILEYLHDGLRKTDEQFKGQFKTAIAWLERQKPVDKEELKKGALKYVARQFMKWLDAKIPNDKMCLSNMECKDIEDAFLKDDWARISHYMRKKLEKQNKTLDPDKVIEWLHYHIQVDEPKIEYNEVGQPLAESFLVHAKARCMAADEVVKQFKKDLGL